MKDFKKTMQSDKTHLEKKSAEVVIVWPAWAEEIPSETFENYR